VLPDFSLFTIVWGVKVAEKALKQLINSLHPLERKLIPYLEQTSSVESLIQLSQMKDVEVMRALQWLQNKKAVKITEAVKEIIALGPNGKLYAEKGLPERRLLDLLKSGPLTLTQVTKSLNLSKDELNICLGVLRKKAAILITKEKEITVRILDQGKQLLSKEMLEERFLKREFPAPVEDLEPEEKFAFQSLVKRKNILRSIEQKKKGFELTELGKLLVKEKVVSGDFIDMITPKVIRERLWKGKEFRRYDIKINVPKAYPVRKQHYRKFLEHVRTKFIALGFKEMSGPVVETEFWNMDALFMPQFHSARSIHDVYYIKEPEYGKLDRALVDRVKKAHENGFGTGSKGWQYVFDVKRTHRNILRSHDTSISPRVLSSKDLQIPGKYFQTVRCFRYDVIDATHLPDFNQTGGFVIEPGINFGHLKGLLKLFAEEFCQTDQVRIKPAYFPFTEPSAQLMAKHPDLGWIELAGSGIFRPEMCKPLGVDVPVIAWGVGVERLAMFTLGLKDIRDLFTHDLEYMRKIRVI